jgi:hypothetical protein
MDFQKNYWLKLGCFLSGYKYEIIQGCSELSAKRVKRYASAILIVCILWGFIGYAFTDRYVKSGIVYSIAGSIVAIVIIVQIERLIILTPKGGHLKVLIARGIIGVSMALIGSLIIDQILFHKDIEQKKNTYMEGKIKKVFTSRSEELKKQMQDSDSTVLQKEIERSVLIEDLSKNPMITVYSRKKVVNNPTGVDSLKSETLETTSSKIPNPKTEILNSVNNQLQQIRLEKIKKDSVYLGLRDQVEKELKSNVGFLEEFEILISILEEYPWAKYVWFIWIVIILGLESLVLIGKVGEKENDYDRALQTQMDLHYKRIDLLASQ